MNFSKFPVEILKMINDSYIQQQLHQKMLEELKEKVTHNIYEYEDIVDNHLYDRVSYLYIDWRCVSYRETSYKNLDDQKYLFSVYYRNDKPTILIEHQDYNFEYREVY